METLTRSRPPVREAPRPLPEPEPEGEAERSVGRALAILFPAIALLVAAEIALAFLVADLVTGHAY